MFFFKKFQRSRLWSGYKLHKRHSIRAPRRAATHAATAYSVPILHFSGNNVGIQSCVPLNDVLSCLFRNRIVPQITVNAIPHEWISQHLVDIPVALAEEQTGSQVTFSAPIGDQTFDAPVPHVMEEQLFAATTDDDPIPLILDDELMLLCYQAQIDQCVHMLKTKRGSCTVREADCCSCRAFASRSLPQQARVAESG